MVSRLQRDTHSIEVCPEEVGVLLSEYYHCLGMVGCEVVAICSQLRACGHGIDSLQRLSIGSNNDIKLFLVLAALLDERKDVGGKRFGLFG
jgi:hypothetical protein